MTKSTKLIFLLMVVMALACYSIAYILSSREVVLDIKNLFLTTLFSGLWDVLYVKNGQSVIWLQLTVIGIGFSTTLIGFFTEPFFLQRLMKDFLMWYTLPLGLLFAGDVLKKKWGGTGRKYLLA